MKYIDFHCHILYEMDFDGPRESQVSRGIYEMQKAQGVVAVCATPHFYPWNEDVIHFLDRRREALERLKAEIPDAVIYPGAEVQVYADLHTQPADKMCIGDSNAILLELPFTPFKPWVISAIENTVFKYSLVPIIAHVERYGLSKDTLRKLASIPHVIFQVNVESFRSFGMLPALRYIYSLGVPVILGSDAHNVTRRPPRFTVANSLLDRKGGFSFFGAAQMLESSMHAQKHVAKLLKIDL
ncbi:MAG: hypothetical protein IJU41_05505 [Clostridia bacterium]|nr:hypothetical protein [Clostridia bacterium]